MILLFVNLIGIYDEYEVAHEISTGMKHPLNTQNPFSTLHM